MASPLGLAVRTAHLGLAADSIAILIITEGAEANPALDMPERT